MDMVIAILEGLAAIFKGVKKLRSIKKSKPNT